MATSKAGSPPARGARTRGNPTSAPKSRKSPTRKSAVVSPSAGPGTSPNRSGRARHDWPTISAQFIEGMRREGEGEDSRYFPTMKELAELHGIAYQTLRERAAKDRWTEAKQKYQIEFERQRYIARSKKLAKQAGEFDERAYTAGNMGVVLIQTRLVEITQQATRLRARREHALQQAEQGLDVDPKDLRSAIYHQELLALGSALERFQAVAMRALGTDVKKIEMAGPEGSAIEVNVHHELTRDDPERVAAVLAAIRDSGQLEDIAALLEGVESTDEDIQDAEVVEDDDEGEAGK